MCVCVYMWRILICSFIVIVIYVGTRLQDIFLYPNPTFEETNPFKAVQRVCIEAPTHTYTYIHTYIHPYMCSYIRTFVFSHA